VLEKFKRTKIVATVGPASSSEKILSELITAGVNTFRLNFSHGTHEEHGQIIDLIQRVRQNFKQPVAILQDLSGPKIRVGMINNSPLKLEVGEVIIFNTDLKVSKKNELPVTYKRFSHDVKTGTHLLLADGKITLKIEKIEHPRVYCKVIIGGELASKKGINYPEGSFTLPALTQKDLKDLQFGLKKGIDYVALSFVRHADDIKRVRKKIKTEGKAVPIIAKIEKHEAVSNLEQILPAVEGVMVARGDLGVEIPSEQVPFIQKQIIRLAAQFGKPVITATQMLLSMVDSPQPTRAETTDIANAIWDGTDAVMLSEETAIGKYPVQAVQMMSKIALEAEKNYPFNEIAFKVDADKKNQIPHSISESAVHLAKDLDAKVIICPTTSGLTANLISRFRSKAIIFALTPHHDVYYRLSLMWNVIPFHFPLFKDPKKMIENALREASSENILQKGDAYVITAGFPFGEGVPTNLINAGIY
jgi:pyruvate kinase